MPRLGSYRTHLGPVFSEAARRLWVALEERDWSQWKLRGELGVGAGVVTGWLYGDHRPSRRLAHILDRDMGIPVEMWDTPPLEAFVLPAARAESGREPAGK